MIWTALVGCSMDYEIGEDLLADPGAPVLEAAPRLSLGVELDGFIEGEVTVHSSGSAVLTMHNAWISGER